MNTPTQKQYRAYAAELPALKPSECSCKTCRGLCAMVPCMGTPQEIKAIIDAGKINILTRKWHLGSVAHGMPPLDIVMVRPVAVGRGCSQFDGEHCALHHTGLKPSEGKFANHAEQASSFWGIASTWFLDENAELVAWLRDQFPALEPLDETLAKMLDQFANVVSEQLGKIENPDDHAEREEICVVAIGQLGKGIRLFQEAQAIAALINGMEEAGIKIEATVVTSFSAPQQKACESVSV